MFVAVLGWLLFAMQTWNKAITKNEVVATYERLSNEIEKEVIRMAEDLAKDPHNLFLLKTGYQHIVFSPDGARKRMKDVLNLNSSRLGNNHHKHGLLLSVT